MHWRSLVNSLAESGKKDGKGGKISWLYSFPCFQVKIEFILQVLAVIINIHISCLDDYIFFLAMDGKN
jgi:hypothetical protein